MDEMNILKKIVAENGNCCWSSPNICKRCPLSKLKTKPDESYMSCIESLGVQDLTEEEADQKYLEAASRILLTAAIEDILEETDDGAG